MATPFSEVYETFLSQVDDYDLAQIDDDELEEVLWGYLNPARMYFYEYPVDFYDVDLDKKCFNTELSHFEIALLSKAMLLQWISGKKNSEELMRKSIGDRDYNAVQGYKYLDSLTVQERKAKQDLNSLMIRSQYSDQSQYGELLQ